MLLPSSAPLIAVLNSSTDLVNVLKTALEDDGFPTVTLVSTTADGAAGPLAFLRRHHPAVAVYSVSPPYREGWEILQEIRQRWQGGAYVITTTNLGALRTWVGPADAIELIGKPYDLEEITQALRRVLAQRQEQLAGSTPLPRLVRPAAAGRAQHGIAAGKPRW